MEQPESRKVRRNRTPCRALSKRLHERQQTRKNAPHGGSRLTEITALYSPLGFWYISSRYCPMPVEKHSLYVHQDSRLHNTTRDRTSDDTTQTALTLLTINKQSKPPYPILLLTPIASYASLVFQALRLTADSMKSSAHCTVRPAPTIPSPATYSKTSPAIYYAVSRFLRGNHAAPTSSPRHHSQSAYPNHQRLSYYTTAKRLYPTLHIPVCSLDRKTRVQLLQHVQNPAGCGAGACGVRRLLPEIRHSLMMHNFLLDPFG